MSMENFLSYLQQLLTMVNPKDEYSVALAKTALQTTIALAAASGKADNIVKSTMYRAEKIFPSLVAHAKDFSGKPGEMLENKQKRQRLLLVLRPSC